MRSSCANKCSCICVAAKKTGRTLPLKALLAYQTCQKWVWPRQRQSSWAAAAGQRETLSRGWGWPGDLGGRDRDDYSIFWCLFSCPRWRGGGQSAEAQFISRSWLTKSAYPPPWLLNGQARTAGRWRWRGEDQVEKNRRQAAGQPTWGRSGGGAGSGLVDVVHLQLGVDNIVQWLKIMKVYSSNRGFELYKDIKVTTDPLIKCTIRCIISICWWASCLQSPIY